MISLERFAELRAAIERGGDRDSVLRQEGMTPAEWIMDSEPRKSAPADLPAVLARVRLTPETRKNLERRWQKRMADEPAVQQAFLSALARHLGDSAR